MGKREQPTYYKSNEKQIPKTKIPRMRIGEHYTFKKKQPKRREKSE